MQPLDKLNKITAECNRVVNGMLDGSVTRDDGLFAATASLREVAIELTQFVSYALPILHTIHQAMVAAQAQQAQAAAQAPQEVQQAGAQALQAQPAGSVQPQQAPANGVLINAGTSTDVQVVDGTPRVRS